MRAVIQRVTRCEVRVEDGIVGRIGPGLLVLLGVAREDTAKDADYLVSKLLHLRVFEDSQGKLNLSLLDIGAQMLVVSQFTLLADCRKGRRPSFVQAAGPELAKQLYDYFVAQVAGQGVAVQTGRFGAAMQVSLVNDGPVTLIVDSQ